MSNTEALPAFNISDRTQSSEGQSNRFNGSQLLMESGSTDIIRKMTNDSNKSGANDLLPNIGFTNGDPPTAPREFPSAIEMYNNVPKNKPGQPTDGGSSSRSGSHSNDQSERSSGNRAGEQRHAGVQIIEDEEEQAADKPNRDKNQDADSKNWPPKPSSPNEKTGEQEHMQPRDQNPVDRNHPLHRERQPQERDNERRQNPQPELMHDRERPQHQLPPRGRENSSSGSEQPGRETRANTENQMNGRGSGEQNRTQEDRENAGPGAPREFPSRGAETKDLPGRGSSDDSKMQHKLNELKTQNKLEDLKTQNKLEDLKRQNKLEDWKTPNKLDELKKQDKLSKSGNLVV